MQKAKQKRVTCTAEKEHSLESELEDESVESSKEEDSDESITEGKKHEKLCTDMKQLELLFFVWDSPPILEENLIGKW